MRRSAPASRASCRRRRRHRLSRARFHVDGAGGGVAICRAFGFAYKQSVARSASLRDLHHPEVGSVGETEQTCREKGIAYVAGRALYRDNARG
jgi:pyruvate/2-oxoglutarate dehydrogenase complex dihydrolipoamide dehydrogenase (E3) component